MKSTRAILGLVLLAAVASMAATPARAEVSFGFVYSNLEPHGAWHVSAQYGNVWQPAVYAPGWNPYYDGHWLYTDVGWTWVSDYHWGAIPYHYGTWALDPYYGWVWVPGYTWAPAWVTFRTSPGYIGWAPVRPGFSLGLSFATAVPVTEAYVYVPTRAFVAPHIRTVAVPATRGRALYRDTTVVRNLSVHRNVVVNRGPDVRLVEHASGRPVRKMKVEEVSGAAPFRNVTRSQLAVGPRGGIRATSSVETLRQEARRSAPEVAAARPRVERDARLERPGPPARKELRASQDRSRAIKREPAAREELRNSQSTDRRVAPQMERSRATKREPARQEQPSRQRPSQKQPRPKPDKH